MKYINEFVFSRIKTLVRLYFDTLKTYFKTNKVTDL